MHDVQHYRHSGRFSTSGLFLGFVFISIFGSGLAVIYAYALRYIPLIYVNALLTVGFGWALGWLGGRFVRAFKARNALLTYVMVFLGTLVAYYMCWVVWMSVHLRGTELEVSIFRLARYPQTVWQLITLFNEAGTWSLGRHSSEPVTGVFLAIVWIIEAAVLFGAALVSVSGRLRTPFCENCQNWCEERHGFANVAAADALAERLLRKDWTALSEAGAYHGQTPAWCALDLHGCPASCDAPMHTLTLRSLAVSIDKKGNTQTQETVLIDRLLLTTEEEQALVAMCDSLEPAPADAPAMAQDEQ